jgi:hypothetical protein
MTHDPLEISTKAGDLLSFGVVVGTLAQLLPAVAAVFTIVWTAIRIYETSTVQRLLGRHRSGG